MIQKIYNTAYKITMWSCVCDPDPNASPLSSKGISRKPIWLRKACFNVFGVVCIWALKRGAKPPTFGSN